MGAYYDEIEIEDMVWDAEKRVYHYPCPCGDRFEISRLQLRDCEDIATCPSCSLIIRVIYDPVSLGFLIRDIFLRSKHQLDFEDEPSDDEEEGESSETSDSDNEDFVDAMDKLAVSEEKVEA